MREQFKKYARLLVRKGVNLQKGQDLLLNAPLEAKELVEEIVEVAYKEIQSGKVHVTFSHSKLGRIAFEHASEEVLLDFPDYQLAKFDELAERGAAVLSITNDDPKLMAGIDPQLLAKVGKETSIKMQPFTVKIMSGNVRWSVGAMPSLAWANLVFPELNDDEAMDKLWDYIFKCTRVDQNDPIKAWDDHVTNLNKKRDYLNKMQFTSLKYTAPGTDLTVGLPKGHIWVAGAKAANDGIDFIPNMPTEEVFTMNHKNQVNGTLRSTMPLNLRGSLVEDFSFVFKDGKVVDYDAKVGKENLKGLLGTDEGAMYLGEVALVPVDSPISNLNTIFFNTLYDENASCHFALGRAYPYTLEGGTTMTPEDLQKAGANHSLTHVDFMVGCEELSIEGIDAKGNTHPIFKNGNWAF